MIYDQFVDATWRPDQDEAHVMIALGGEAGEVLNEYKKHRLRGPDTPGHQPANYIKDELGDLLYYVVRAAHFEGMTLDQLMVANMRKLIVRRDREGQETPKEFRDAVALFIGPMKRTHPIGHPDNQEVPVNATVQLPAG